MADKENEVSRLGAVLASAGRIAKKGLRAAVIVGAIMLPTCSFFNMWGRWVYQVRTNYGVVITDWDGQRIAVGEPGWHTRAPFISTYEEEYPLANQAVLLHGKIEPHQVITNEGAKNDVGSVIMAAAVTFYEIRDLRQYAIENVKAELKVSEKEGPAQPVTMAMNPRIMIQQTLDSIIGDHIQKSDPRVIIHNRGVVEKEILEAIVNSGISERFGIKINGFNFIETSYISEVVYANARKQAAVAQAEGEFSAALIEKKSTVVRAEAEFAAAQVRKKSIETLAGADAEQYRILEKALNPKTDEERRFAQEIFQSLVKYRTLRDRPGDTVWMIPESTPVLPTYNPANSVHKP